MGMNSAWRQNSMVQEQWALDSELNIFLIRICKLYGIWLFDIPFYLNCWKLRYLWLLSVQGTSTKDFNVVCKIWHLIHALISLLFKLASLFNHSLAFRFTSLLGRHVHWLVKGIAVVHSWVLIYNLVRLGGGWYAEFSLFFYSASSLNVHDCHCFLHTCSLFCQAIFSAQYGCILILNPITIARSTLSPMHE